MNNKFKELQRNMLIMENYVNGNIKKVLNAIENTKVASISPNCNDKEWVKYIGKTISKLKNITALLPFKKLEANKNDLKEIGKYLQKLGKELETHEFKNNKSVENNESNDSKLDNDLNELKANLKTMKKIIELFGED